LLILLNAFFLASASASDSCAKDEAV
jgi:hypothetical protein